MPRRSARARRLAEAAAWPAESHNTLSSTRDSNRIQTSKTAGVILAAWLKQQNTKPCAGNPASLRVGVRAATSRTAGLQGAIPTPQFPISTVVTPCHEVQLTSGSQQI